MPKKKKSKSEDSSTSSFLKLMVAMLIGSALITLVVLTRTPTETAGTIQEVVIKRCKK